MSSLWLPVLRSVQQVFYFILFFCACVTPIIISFLPHTLKTRSLFPSNLLCYLDLFNIFSTLYLLPSSQPTTTSYPPDLPLSSLSYPVLPFTPRPPHQSPHTLPTPTSTYFTSWCLVSVVRGPLLSSSHPASIPQVPTHFDRTVHLLFSPGDEI